MASHNIIGKPQIRPPVIADMNAYYYMQDKGPQAPCLMPHAGSMPGCGSMQAPLSSLGAYGAPQPQNSSIPGAGSQPSLAQHQQPPAGYSSMQGPTNPTAFQTVAYTQSPYAAPAALYQSPLAYSQATMAAQNSAAAYMAAAAGAQSGSPYGSVRLPTTSPGFATSPSGQLYGYPSSLNGQPMYASHPGSMQAGMHPHLAAHQQGMSSVPPGYPGSSISSLAGGPRPPTMSTMSYPGSHFARLP